MTVEIAYSDDPAWVLTTARRFLASEPVLHNMILTILLERVAQNVPGRYWLATEGKDVVGVVFQSPLSFPANLSSMRAEVIGPMVKAISHKGDAVPGAMGESAVVARFAGHWTEQNKSAAVPIQGLRIYEVTEVKSPVVASGQFRKAVTIDRDLVVHWLRNFHTDIGEPRNDIEEVVDRRLVAGQIWLWVDNEPLSMAVNSVKVEGVTRIQVVYTPPEFRNRGYSRICVGKLSQQILNSDSRPILYTDLGNPVSNSVFRQIGFRAAFECLRYRFE